MKCHECRGSDCCHAWETPRTCEQTNDIKWLVLAYTCFIVGVGLSLWGATR